MQQRTKTIDQTLSGTVFGHGIDGVMSTDNEVRSSTDSEGLENERRPRSDVRRLSKLFFDPLPIVVSDERILWTFQRSMMIPIREIHSSAEYHCINHDEVHQFLLLITLPKGERVEIIRKDPKQTFDLWKRVSSSSFTIVSIVCRIRSELRHCRCDHDCPLSHTTAFVKTWPRRHVQMCARER